MLLEHATLGSQLQIVRMRWAVAGWSSLFSIITKMANAENKLGSEPAFPEPP